MRMRLRADRGGMYGDDEHVTKLNSLGEKRSMSRTSNPWCKAVIESFFSTLRFELLDRRRFEDQAQAERSIRDWIENFYNPKRRHTSIGNMSPINYELACAMRKRRL